MRMPPAEPILASKIYTSLREVLAQCQDTSTLTPPAKLASKVKAIDHALDGGFDTGAIHCIVPDTDQDAGALLQTLIIEHLGSSPAATAIFIDCSSSFDLQRLHRVLDEAAKANETADRSRTALQTLEQLQIMKVFDHIGLSDAMTEAGELLESNAAAGTAANAKPMRLPKSTIEDSEDEEDIHERLSLGRDQESHHPALPLEVGEPRPSGLLIIDSISQLFSPLIKNNYASGQAVLSSCMRLLSHITRRNEFCTIVVSHVSNRPASEEESLSLFGSCTVQPALGLGYEPLVDMIVYLHSVPSRETTRFTKEGIMGAPVDVFEIVKDRHGSRFGRWAPFRRNMERGLQDL